MKNSFARIALLAFVCFTTVLINAPSMAQIFWEKTVSRSGLFATLMRVEKQDRSDSMLVSEDRAVYSEEVFANIDHRPYKNVYRSYNVRLDQTFGPGLSKTEKTLLAEQEINKMIDAYKQRDFVLKSRDTLRMGKNQGESIFLVYSDPIFGVQGLKVNVMYANVSKITQTIVGPAETIEDGQNYEFLNSFEFEDGLPLVTRKFADEWPVINSPHNIYSIQMPPKTYAFYEDDPQIHKTDNAEMMGFIFKDPVRQQNIFFNTYGYAVADTLDFAKVEKIIGENHIRKHRRDPSKVGLVKGLDGEVPYLEAMYMIPPTKKVPYMNMVKLRAYFSANHIFVQEVMGSQTLVDTAFIHNVMALYKFHPEKSDIQPAPQVTQPVASSPVNAPSAAAP